MHMKKRALLSVSDKTGIVEFAKELVLLGYEIISTGGTAAALNKAGVHTIKVSDVTGFDEILDGRVKTLHPRIHAGLLARRDNIEHMECLKKLDIVPIDLVAINLYPFKKTIEGGADFDTAIENIDIGGPAMLRAAAKNSASVIVICDPSDYEKAIKSLQTSVCQSFRLELMQKVYAHTGGYDTMISAYLLRQLDKKEQFPFELCLNFEREMFLRYGENPHQEAAFYVEKGAVDTFSNFEQLQGKALSYLNINDAFAAVSVVREFDAPCVCIIKHASPCGVAIDKDIVAAYKKALDCDSVSAFGGIVAINKKVTKELAKELVKIFLEVVVAEDFDIEALKILSEKENLRLVKLPSIKNKEQQYYDYKRVEGGLLVQENDDKLVFDTNKIEVVTKKQPNKDEMSELEFAMKVVKHVKSNAIVVAKDNAAVGICGGQTSRVASTMAAIERAGDRAKGAVAASDAFFPFPDCVTMLIDAGIKAIVQPGGSVKDEESVAVCDERGVSMVMTGNRHFRH